ncbi:MAG TPA: ABC transporter permease [Burkholderiales bacterium]|nr:ABC transporter permease [Burkholderiales bacterium]
MQSAATTGIQEPEIRLTQGRDGARTVALSGAWDIRALRARAAELGRALGRQARAASWDLTAIQRLDHIGALLIWRAWDKRRPAALALRPEHDALFSRLGALAEAPAPRTRPDLLEPLRALGDFGAALAGGGLEIVRLLGQVALDALGVLRDPARGPWREISAGVYRAGAQALGITALVGFLIGVVLSYLSAEQLKDFGANAFVINIVGIGVVRELGPMLTAILVAGRSGSAITAQLGVMRVTEELDALAVMGIPLSMRLVFPKVASLAVALPLLVLWTDAIALAGGMISAKWQLGIAYRTFVESLPAAVPIANYWIGLGKGAAFGVLIALIACHFGLRIEPNTESLGAGTTRSVVAAITVVIIVDAIVAVIFSGVGMGLR